MVGVLSFADPSVLPFSPDRRKDAEFHSLLVQRGVPAGNIELLLDEDASLTAIFASVERVARRSTAQSTFLFYYAGHGGRDEHGTYLLAHDTQGATDGLRIAELTRILTRHFRGRRLILMGDCCYSGALAEVARAVRRERPGVEVWSLTSAEASNLSTSSWIFTQSVIDTLAGDPLCDRNQDGHVSVAELRAEVKDAMKYREGQRYGDFIAGLPDTTPLALARGRRPSPGGPPLIAGDYVRAPHERGALPARIREAGSAESVVRFYLYNHAEDRRLPNGSLVPIRFRRYPAGQALRVYWGGKLWDAKVLQTDGDFHFVTYPGWPSYWDEWITSSRVEEPASDSRAPTLVVGSSVQVEWRGNWYAAIIVQAGNGRYFVHYLNYDTSWDEWVPPQRIRAPR